MADHLLLLIIFALCVSAVLAVLQRDTPRAQVRFGLWLAGAFVGAALILGWLMYPFPL
jgi:hypothetical protein